MKKLDVEQKDLEPLKDIIKNTRGGWKQLITSDNGDTEEAFRAMELPKSDVIHPQTPTVDLREDARLSIEDRVETKIMLRYWAKDIEAKEITNSMVYLPNTLMKWHTNSDNPGIRRYYTFTKGDAWFAYVDEQGNVQYDKDNVGWTVREFETPVWHSVWTNQLRFSFGLRMS